MIHFTDPEGFQLDTLLENREKNINSEVTSDELQLAESPPELSPQGCVVSGQISWKPNDNILLERIQGVGAMRDLM